MKKKIKESIGIILAEYKRLKLKQKKNIISKEEKETLEKLKYFLGK